MRTTLDINAMAQHMMRCIESGDLDAVAKLNAPEMRVWHNFDNAEMSWDQAAPFLKLMRESTSALVYEDVRITPLADGWLQQHVLRMVAKDGSSSAMPAALVIKLNDAGKIVRIEEYLDMKPMLAAMPFLQHAA